MRRRREGVVRGVAMLGQLRSGGPFFLVPTSARDPFASRSFCCFCRDHLHDFVPAFCLEEIQVHQGITQPGKMAMTFDETRHDKFALQVHHFGRLSAIGLHGCFVTKGQDASVLDGQGRRGGLVRVNRIDVGIGQDQICRHLVLFTGGKQE